MDELSPSMRVSSSPPDRRRLPNLLSATIAVAAAIALTFLADALIGSENPHHAAIHLSIAAPQLVFTGVLAWWGPPPKPTRLARSGRRLLVVGLLMVITGSTLEAIGAFGYDSDRSRIDALTTIHNTSWVVQFPGALAAVIGVTLALASVPQSPRRSLT